MVEDAEDECTVDNIPHVHSVPRKSWEGPQKGSAGDSKKAVLNSLLTPFDHSCHDCDCTYPYSPYPDLSTPILSHQNHSQAPNAKPEPSGSIPSQLVSNTLLNTPTPLRLVDAFLTQHSFYLSSSLRQVDSWHPHSFLTRRSFHLSFSSCQVNFWHPHSFLTRCHSTFFVLASSPFPMFHQSRDGGQVKPDRIPPSLNAS